MGMDGVRSSDLDAVLSLLAAAAEAPVPDALAGAVVPGLRSLIGCDSVAYNDLVLDPPRARFIADPSDAGERADSEAAARTMHQHPLMAYQRRTGDQTARTVSEFITRRDMHRLDFYNDFWKPLEIEHQLWLALAPVAGVSAHISLQRQRRDFTPREVAIGDLLRPHLSAAYVQAAARKAIDELAGEVIFLDRDGRPDRSGPEVRQLLSAYFPGAPNGGLPAPLGEWVERARADFRRGVGLGRAPEPLVRTGDAGTLTVRFVGASGERERDALLLVEDLISGLGDAALGASGLTDRQAEVLRWAARGVPNDAIAVELAISTRTVEKHLERAYRRLGVSSRGEAVRLLRNAPG